MTVLLEPDEVRAAVAKTLHGFPLPTNGDSRDLLHSIALPVLEELPPHLQCEVVGHALMTVFTMGLAAGYEVAEART